MHLSLFNKISLLRRAAELIVACSCCQVRVASDVNLSVSVFSEELLSIQ